MRQSHQLIINSLAVAGQNLVLMAIGLILPPFVVHQLGNDTYGVAVTIGSIISFVTLIQAGMPQALSRCIAIARQRQDEQELSRVMSTGLAFLLTMAAVVAAVVLVFVLVPELVLAWPTTMSRQTVQLIIVILGGAAVLSLPLSFGHMNFIGRERFVLHAALQAGGFLLRFVMIYGLLLAFPGSIIAYAISNSGAVTLHAGLVLLLALVLFKTGRLSIAAVHFGILKEMLSFGTAVTLSSLALLLYVQADYLLIGKLLSTADVTIFSLALTWCLVLRNVLKSATSVITPAAARTQVAGDHQALVMMLMRTTKYGLLVSAAPLVFLFFYRYQLMNVWMGEGYAAAGTIMLPILIAEVLSHAVTGGTEMLVGMGKVRVLLIIDIVGGLANIALALIVAFVFKQGLMGFAIAYLVVLGIRNGLVLPIYFMHVFKIRLLDYLGGCYAKSLLCTLLLVPCVYLISGQIAGKNWLQIFLAATVTMLCFAPLAALVGLDAYDRGVLGTVFRGIIKRATGR